MSHPAQPTRRAPAALLRAWTLAGALSAGLPAHATPFPAASYSGTITRASFTPSNPFGVDIGPGTPFTLEISAGAPYLLVFTIAGRRFVTGQLQSMEAVDSTVGDDQLTLLANNGGTTQTKAAYAMEVVLQGGADALDSGAAPRFDRLTLRAFSLDGTEHRGDMVYQYELAAEIRQEQGPLPTPGTLVLLAAGVAGALGVRMTGTHGSHAK